MREIAKLRSDEMQKMRLQIDGKTDALNQWISDLQEKLQHSRKYISQLEECCGSAGVPVAAIQQTFSGLTTSGRQSESDDEALCAAANRTPSTVLAPAGRGGASVMRRYHYMEEEDYSPP
ncbi:hypothetical protein AAFF_G00387940 [Aldrovandia affinis]|uniref:Uncharacterized protein n=1 Tax=Aldrovandia affinis TaxID=143900 RepID=A0AAD7SF74_9TELE|nr:hypothetical protein AAFF_G00387940 [Aldrovandia affinis]